MLSFLRFLKGYLRIRVIGYSPERFMNLCLAQGIFLWDIEEVCESSSESTKTGTEKVLNISLRDFYRLKPIAKKTKTRIYIMKRYGWPFLKDKMAHHKVFIAGLFMCLAVLYMLSHFVWAIDLNGNTKLTKDIFEDFLEQEHIAIGMPISEVDIDAFEKNLRNEYNYITWASAKIVGTRLCVEVKENMVDDIKKEPQSSAPADLISGEDGIIISMITRNGVPMKKSGETVQKGDILVSGRIPVLNDDATVKDYHLCISDADIIVQTTYRFEATLPASYTDKKATGNVYNRYGVRLGNIFFRLGNNIGGENLEAVQEYKQLCVLRDFYLPVYYGKTVYTEYEAEQKKYTKKQAKDILTDKFRFYEESLIEKGVQIIEKDVKIEQVKDGFRILAEVIVNVATGQTCPSPSLEESQMIQKNQEGQNIE